MNLAQALKKKNRLAQKIIKLQQEIQKENSARADDPRKIKVEVSMKDLDSTVSELIKLKVAIFVAATPMREHILKIGELKSRIVFLGGISTSEGIVNDYGDDPVQYKAVYDKVWIKNQIEECEELIDTIQDELDKFNYATNIEV